MSRIELELGGNYTAGQAFNKASDDFKGLARKSKDMSDAGVSALNAIGKAAGTDLTGQINLASSAIKSLAQGGIWGLLGSLASSAIGMVVQKFKEAKENAEFFSSALSTSISNTISQLGNDFSAVKGQAEKAKADIESVTQAANTGIANTANAKIYEIHADALSKIVDGMTEEQKNLVKASEGVSVAMANEEMVIEQTTNTKKASSEKVRIASELVEKAQQNLADVENNRASFTFEQTKIIEERNKLIQELNGYDTMYKMGVVSESDYMARRIELSKELQKIESDNKELMAANKQQLDAERKAKEELTLAEQGLKTSLENQKLSEEVITQKRKEATDAVLVAEQKLSQAKYDQAHAIEIAKANTEEAVAEQEQITKLKKEANYKLYALMKKYQVTAEQRTTLTEKMNKLIEDGNGVDSTMFELKKELLKLKEEEKKLLEESNKQKQEENNSKKSGKDNGKGSSSSASLSVSIGNTDEMGKDISDEVDKKGGFKNWQRNQRDELRKGRDEKNNMKIDQAKMTKALKGEMPEEEARQWMEYAKKRYTPDQMKELGNLAMNKQMLSKKEAQQQVKKISQMVSVLQKSLTVR